MRSRAKVGMKWTTSIFVALLFTALSQTVRAQEAPVWFWFANCAGPTMALEVRLDRRVIFKSSFPLCHAEPPIGRRTSSPHMLSFRLNSDRAIKWEGYRDDNPVSPAHHAIRGDIWLAGSDPDDLLLGVSFMDSKMIYMNTIHIARPNQRDQSEIETGLTITTYPIRGGA
jgi:hypothetical protein